MNQRDLLFRNIILMSYVGHLSIKMNWEIISDDMLD